MAPPKKSYQENNPATIQKMSKFNKTVPDSGGKTRKVTYYRPTPGTGYDILTDDVMNTGNPEVLRSFRDENREALEDEKNAPAKRYLDSRIQVAEKIEEMELRAKGQSALGYTPPKPEADLKDGFLGLSEIKYPDYQTSANGCWSISYSMLLKSRGVDLSQEEIRQWRPNYRANTPENEKPNPERLLTMNSDRGNSVYPNADLAVTLLPNTAMNSLRIEPFESGQLTVGGEPLNAGQLRTVQTEYYAQVKKTLQENIREALVKHRSPVSIAWDGHYVTITGISEDGNTLRYEDSVGGDRDLPRTKTMSLDTLVLQGMQAHDHNGMHYDSGGGFEMAWLSDLPQAQYGSEEKPELNPRHKDYVKMDGQGEIAVSVPYDAKGVSAAGSPAEGQVDGKAVEEMLDLDQSALTKKLGVSKVEGWSASGGVMIGNKGVYYPKKAVQLGDPALVEVGLRTQKQSIENVQSVLSCLLKNKPEPEVKDNQKVLDIYNTLETLKTGKKTDPKAIAEGKEKLRETYDFLLETDENGKTNLETLTSDMDETVRIGMVDGLAELDRVFGLRKEREDRRLGEIHNELERKKSFLETYRRRVSEVRDTFRRNSEIEFLKDPAGGMRAYEELSDAQYLERRICDRMAESFKLLTKEQQLYLYESLFPTARKQLVTADGFLAYIKDTAPYNGGSFFGSMISFMGAGKVAEELDKLLSKEEKKKLARDIDAIVPPSSPDFPKERLSVCPEQPQIEALLKGIAPDSPRAEEKKDILRRAGNALRISSNEASFHYDAKRSGFSNTKLEGLENGYDHLSDQIFKDYIDNDYGDKTLKDKLPKNKGGAYEAPDINRQLGLTPEQFRAMRSAKSGISPELRKRVTDISAELDGIGWDVLKKHDGMVRKRVAPDGSVSDYLLSEQGNKLYAFGALLVGHDELRKALGTGDLESIREKTEECERIRKHMDRMMELAKEAGDFPLAGGNITPTRTEASGTNELPPEYLKEYNSLSKVNSILQLNILCKNNGVTPNELLDDPVGKLTDIVKRKLRKSGPNAPKTSIGKLALGLSNSGCINMSMDLTIDTSALMHATGGIAGMAASEEERRNIIGSFNLAIIAARQAVAREMSVWNKLSSLPADKQKALYTAAFLMPEKEFDVLKAGEALDSPDWQKKFDPASMAENLRDAGKLDLSEMLRRLKEAEQALNEQPEQGKSTQFSAAEYMRAATDASKLVLLNAPEEQRRTEACQQLEKQTRKSIVSMIDREEKDRRAGALKDAEKNLSKDGVAKALADQVAEEKGGAEPTLSAGAWIESYKDVLHNEELANDFKQMADYPALYVARIMAARELSNSTRGKASTLNRQLKAEEIDKRAAELLANKNFRSFADLTNHDKATADKVKEIFSKKHSHGGELDDMFRSYLRTLPAGELRNDAELRRWMPTVKERVESLQEQAQKSLKAGREVYREAAEIVLLRTMAGVKRGGEGLDKQIPVRDGNKDIPSVSKQVVMNADAREVREAFDKANGAKYICSGHGGKMIENIAKASVGPANLKPEADVPVKTKTAGDPERGPMPE